MAFILAGLVFGGTVIVCVFMLFAAGMSDSPSASASVPIPSTFIAGTIIAVLIGASHWLPQIPW